jgi:transposase InsO family protein
VSTLCDRESLLDINWILCAFNNLQYNAQTERIFQTVKKKPVWLNELGSFEEAEARIGAWIDEDYNRLYVHSALGYLSPEEVAQQWAQTQEAKSAGAQI